MDANIASVALVVGAIAATAGGLIKAIVDAVTVVWPDRPRWAPVVMALCGGPVLVLLLQVAAGGAMTAQTWLSVSLPVSRPARRLSA